MTDDRQHVIDELDAYVHGLLDESEAAHVERHCSECESCHVELEQARRRRALLEEIPMTEASEDLIQQTVGRIDGRLARRKRFRKRYLQTVLGLVAASVLIIGGLNLHYVNLSASPYDLQVLGQTDLQAGSRASLRVAVFDQQTREAVAQVPVRLLLSNRGTGEKVELVRFATDGQGASQPLFELPDWDAGEYELHVVASPEGGEETVTRTISLKRTSKLMVSTDKPVYQPGQTIRVRALGLRKPDLQPVAGREAEFWISDPKGNVIFRQKELTSKFGITSTDCPLATEILEGPYTINCRLGTTETATTVSVEKYVLPKFQVAVSLDQPWYQPGQPVKATVQADYFFGKPVAEGTYEVFVQAPDVGLHEIHHKEGLELDEQGSGEFEFVLPQQMVGREQDSGNARFNVVVTVTDSANQKHTVGRKRIVTSNPIGLEVIPETGRLVRGVSNRVYVFAGYADGKPAQVRLTVAGGPQVETIETSQAGVAAFELTPSTDSIGLTIRATDEQGLVGRKHVTLQCGQVASDFILRTDKAVYTGGETVNVVALGGGNESLFVDFLKDGQTVLTEAVAMQNGRGEYAFDLPPELFGTLQLCAYRFGPSGLPVMKTRTIFIARAGDVAITAELDHDEYRPGKKAKLKLTLKDESGKAAPGAISLSAVDEAVYAVLSQKPGMESAFFQLEEELLDPVYQIYNWMPDFDGRSQPLAERAELEQALFARTAMDVDNPAGTSASPLTLQETSYPEKVERVRIERHDGLQGVRIAWRSLLWGVSGACVLALALFATRIFLIGSAVLGGLGLLAVGVMVTVSVVAPDAHFTEVATDAMAEADWADDDAAVGMAAGADMPQEAAQFGDDFATDEGKSEPSETAPGSRPVRVRQWFPETLLWRPELITDDAGVATIEIDLADSITTWRVNASAVTAQGKLGALSSGVRVFQPFFVDLNLPVAMTRNDQVAVPVVVYNYLDEANEVELTLENDEWFELLDGDDARVQTVELKPNEVRAVHFRLRVKDVGRHALQVTARGGAIADAVRREIDVVPDGRRVEQVVNGTLSEPVDFVLNVPEDAIPGSVKALVKLYPSSFSQLVEGLDGIFQRPSGCFEQTSSTTYPNVLALDYLKRTNLDAPEVEAKARQYIHLGYQRLLSFEVDGGGFDWFGNPPANQTLTAYGLMEFVDMAEVHDVDPKLIERTRNWLLQKRRADGAWAAEVGMLDDGLAGSVQQGNDLDLTTTAYIGWAVFGNNAARDRSQQTLDYLLAHRPETIQSVNTLATVANAILAIDPQGDSAVPYLTRLESLKKTSKNGKAAWWELGEGGNTMFYGSGRAGDIETTALATLALLRGKQNAGTIKAALNWLVEQKDQNGTWHTTQATVLSLKALILGTSAALGDDEQRTIEVLLDGQVVETVIIAADQADVMQQLNLSDRVTESQQTLTLRETTETGTGFQVAFSHHVPEANDVPPEAGPLSIDVTYDRSNLQVNESVTATAKVTNNMDVVAPMVILDLPIPAGFKIDTAELSRLQTAGKIAKFQINARSAVVYLRGLASGATLELQYKLEATMPVKVQAPAATIYEYYNPDRRGQSRTASLQVRA